MLNWTFFISTSSMVAMMIQYISMMVSHMYDGFVNCEEKNQRITIYTTSMNNYLKQLQLKKDINITTTMKPYLCYIKFAVFFHFLPQS